MILLPQTVNYHTQFSDWEMNKIETGRDNKWDVKNIFKFYHIMIAIVPWVYSVHVL